MNIQEGGVYTIKEEYIDTYNLWSDKSCIVAISEDTRNGIFSGVRMGNFKNRKNSKNRLFIDLNYNGKKHIAVIACDEILSVQSSAVDKEIALLDFIKVRRIKDCLFDYKNELDGINHENDDLKHIENLITDNTDMLQYVKSSIDGSNITKAKKILKYVGVILSYLFSFFGGVFASYCANHWDNGITKIIDSVYNFIDWIRNLFLK